MTEFELFGALYEVPTRKVAEIQQSLEPFLKLTPTGPNPGAPMGTTDDEPYPVTDNPDAPIDTDPGVDTTDEQ
jgi:hypothetical protein